MKISIVVPAFNEEKLLVPTLASIKRAAQTFVGRGWEIETVVCDNNSTDRTAELARAGGARVVFEPINQISRARNTGAAAATGQWIIFVDADSHPSVELFEDVARAIESDRFVGGGAIVRIDHASILPRIAEGIWNTLSRSMKWCAGSFIFCEASAFREVQGFSLELFASEEIDFSRKLKGLAKNRGKRLIIFSQHPLVTSGRKIDLYPAREHLRIMVKAFFLPKTLTRRNECRIWYDGRR